MRYSNKIYRFSYEIPEGFEVLDRSEYPRYHIDPYSTIEILIKYEENGVESISINRDDNFKDDEEFEEIIDANVRNMGKMGMKTEPKEKIASPNGRHLGRVYSTFKGLKYVTYFSNIRNTLIAASAEIKVPGDKNDTNILNLFSSIEEE